MNKKFNKTSQKLIILKYIIVIFYPLGNIQYALLTLSVKHFEILMS